MPVTTSTHGDSEFMQRDLAPGASLVQDQLPPPRAAGEEQDCECDDCDCPICAPGCC